MAVSVDDAKINHIVIRGFPPQNIQHDVIDNQPSFFNMATCHFIEPITSLLKINVKLVPELLAFEEFYHSMFDFFWTEKG